MTSVDAKPPPPARLESQYEDLIGSADVDDAAALLVGHTNAIGDGTKSSGTNGVGSHEAVDDGAKAPAANGAGEEPAPSEALGQPNFPTGTEKPGAIIPPLQPEGKKNNKAVPWYDSDPIKLGSLIFFSLI